MGTTEAMGGMDGLARAAAARTDAELAAREAALRRLSQADLQALRPPLDPAEARVYPRLIQALRESAANRENARQLGARLLALGSAVLELALKLAPR
jgi:hypothetical protein